MKLQKIHILGAGGVGMSGLALLAKRMGVTVTASDHNDTPYLRKLAEKGIAVHVGTDPARIPADAHIFYSSAIREGDPERLYAEQKGQRCEPRHALLKLITQNYFTIAIAGCHGKTTSSAWVAYLLTLAGYDPTALVGGTVVNWSSNYREGAGMYQDKPLLVIEADESDRSFLAIDTHVALVTNVDLDHTDVYADLHLLTRDFLQFAKKAQTNGGWLLVSKEAPATLVDLLPQQDKLRWSEIEIDEKNHAVCFRDRSYSVGLLGTHNLLNATLVLQLGLRLNVPEKVLQAALAGFSGVARRMQKIAHLPQLSLSVIDDYAHHPQEIAVTLSALAQQYARLLIFWEPHRLSRFNHFHREFDAVLQKYAGKHCLYVLPLFPSSDRHEDYPETEIHFAKFKTHPYVLIEAEQDFARTAWDTKSQSSAAVFLGAGKSSNYAHAYADWLRRRISEEHAASKQ